MASCVDGKCRLSLAVGLTVTLILSIGLTLLQTQTALAAFPGANGKIAFTSQRDGDGEIFVMNADGTGQTQLTSNTEVYDYEPDRQPIRIAPVGGVVVPADKLGLLVPWIGLLGLVGAVTAAIAVRKRRRD